MHLPFIADIKRNSLDDGPGIRSTVFFKGCPLSCSWCHNPECIHAGPELLFRPADCIDCRDCVANCPNGAIGPTGPGSLDRSRCHRSGRCADECPTGALELVGRRYDLDELLALLLRDQAFYRNSGGGVTLSGGEATLFGDYAGALARRLREAGAHVLLETCGHFEWRRFATQLLPYLDTIYFDLKLADPSAHERWCGRDNGLILENLDRLLEDREEQRLEVLVRVPLVPNVTCTEANLTAIATLLRGRGAQRVALLPYNP
ncbi:MAG: glycyl-radical enzyme activating protein, partial [Deltaproteobacteria bacterium]|nr:glycyl-radical enzyme activating protein [Deltaproteobacteria bacterium]